MADKNPSKADYDVAEPYAQGYMAYTFSHWPGSAIPETCPYASGTPEALRFRDREHAAILNAQDSEE